MYSVRNVMTGAVMGLLTFGSISVAVADQILAYFDVSGSVSKDARAGYYHDFKKVEFRPGDTVVVLTLGEATHEFAPVAKVKIPLPQPGASSEQNHREHEKALQNLRAAVRLVLNRNAKQTNVIGALVSARDYYTQEGIAPEQRNIYIFSDMIHEAGGVSYRQKAPDRVPGNLPKDLVAKVHVIGVTTSMNRQEAVRQFWDRAIRTTGSMLVTYRQRL